MSANEELKEKIIIQLGASATSCLLLSELIERLIRTEKELKKTEKELKKKEKELKKALHALWEKWIVDKKETTKGEKYCLFAFGVPGEIGVPGEMGKIDPRVKMGIVKKLWESSTHSLSLVRLKKDVKINETRLKRALQELYNEWKIRRVMTPKGENCLLPKSNINSAATGYKLYNSVNKEKKELTAKKLANKLSLDSSYVFKVCRRLENGGYIKRGAPEEKRLFFAPLTGEIIHSGNYERVIELNHELSNIVSKFSLKDPRLKQNLQKSLGRMLERKDLAKFSEPIGTFKHELLTKVSRAKTKKEARELLGLRPFLSGVTTWKHSK